jgi:phage terminase large subunit-like protein
VPAPVIDLSRVAPEHREEARELLAEYAKLVAANPLEAFEPHSPAQRSFLEARTRIVAAFAGNRFGKSTSGVVKALNQVLPDEFLPDWMLPLRLVPSPCHGWILAFSEAKVMDSIVPAIQKWCPPAALRGGRWDKAFNGDKMILSFACGSTIAFKTYQQDSSSLESADLDWVLYDEPPPKGHRNACLMRMARGVREWYAMTPLRAHVGWIRREIWSKREDPNITVVTGEIHENPTLSAVDVEFILSQYSDEERAAREKGVFMHTAGLVYKRFESGVVPPPNRVFVRGLERVVGIDPGIRNAAFIFGGFDPHGVDWLWDELLIQDGTPSDYVEGIDRILGSWGLKRSDCLFVIDPAARQRSQATGDTVQSELARVGLFTMNGVRDREAGQQQVRDRLKHGRLKVSEACLGLRDEAEEFIYPLTEDGEEGADIGPADDAPFHRLATLRYQVMTRPFYPLVEEMAGNRSLGWQPGRTVRLEDLKVPEQVGPLGPLM